MNNYGPIALASDALQLSVGGRWSDRTLRRLQIPVSERNANGKILSRYCCSKLPVMPLLRPSVLACAWMAHYKINIACPAVILFIAGFS